MNVFGVDLSLTSTGIAFPGGETAVLAPKGLSGVVRLDWFHERFVELIPDGSFVAVEGYSFGSRNSQSHALGELGGVVRWTFFRGGVRFVDVPPTSRAKFATGKGNAGKSAVVSAVSARTGRVWDRDDEVDAFVLQEMALTRLGCGRYDWPSENRKALDKIDWSPFEAS